MQNNVIQDEGCDKDELDRDEQPGRSDANGVRKDDVECPNCQHASRRDNNLLDVWEPLLSKALLCDRLAHALFLTSRAVGRRLLDGREYAALNRWRLSLLHRVWSGRALTPDLAIDAIGQSNEQKGDEE